MQTIKPYTVLLVDQSGIPASFKCISLFLNNTHILDTDSVNDHPIEMIADNLAISLGQEVTHIQLSELELAEVIAKRLNQYDQFNADIAAGKEDFDEWVQGYTNDDVLAAALYKLPKPPPLGLAEALEERAEDDDIALYLTQVGLFDLTSDPNTAFDTYDVVTAAYSPEGAAESAINACRNEIATRGAIRFDALASAEEYTPSET
jgi:hypothetical protein